MFKKLLALIMLTTMALGTVASAQEVTGEGFSSIPIEYETVSHFTVVLPDSISLDSTKIQEFEIYLKDFELVENDKVKVKPTTSNIIMNNNPKPIEYLVSAEATSFDGLPTFPVSRKVSTSQGTRTETYFNYILTKTSSGNFKLYCTTVSTAGMMVKRDELEGTYTLAVDDTSALKLYNYNASTNAWEINNVNSTVISQNELVIQSTVSIMDGEEAYIQLSKEIKNPINIPITMEQEYLTDSTPIKCTIDGTSLTSGRWSGELMFEISLVQ